MRNYKILYLEDRETFEAETLPYSDTNNCQLGHPHLGSTYVIAKDNKMAGL